MYSHFVSCGFIAFILLFLTAPFESGTRPHPTTPARHAHCATHHTSSLPQGSPPQLLRRMPVTIRGVLWPTCCACIALAVRHWCRKAPAALDLCTPSPTSAPACPEATGLLPAAVAGGPDKAPLPGRAPCDPLGLARADGTEAGRRRSVAMAAWAGQSWNGPAVAALGRVLRQPALGIPHVCVPDIGHLDFAALRRAGVKGVVFDKDNTLTAPYVDAVHPAAAAGLAQCSAAYGPALCVLSNSAGTPDDVGGASAARIEAALGVHVVRHRDKKPEGLPEVLRFFEAQCGTAVRPEELCVIGDRVLTDVVFGNLHGALTVHVRPLTTAGDNAVARLVRPLESALFLALLRRCLGLRPVRHPLCAGTPNEFVLEAPNEGP